MQKLKFKDIKNYISRIDPVIICLRETMDYDLYRNIAEVESIYEELWVQGMGLTEIDAPEAIGLDHSKGVGFEIMLSDKPIFDKDEES